MLLTTKIRLPKQFKEVSPCGERQIGSLQTDSFFLNLYFQIY